ncbi:hypothetical protein LR48_Vigan01g213100 [Vigna angularis]|uniref:Uncharacterized protein n=1 Tax=Phaseolus angularis TaxID=3914 RepID=A0A0L9TPT9_PHAAN|nr:uncharacterized protein HKW66_Vig0031990 [Vigna angularis]KOM32575.1 hypothetical protein LR48_Vigan01g213100 [Vigna angularis]
MKSNLEQLFTHDRKLCEAIDASLPPYLHFWTPVTCKHQNRAIEEDEQEEDEQDEEEPVHLLDYLQSCREIKMPNRCLHLRKYRIGTVRITKSSNSLYPIFMNGQLKLPPIVIVVDGSMALISMCLGFRNDLEITSSLPSHSTRGCEGAKAYGSAS